MPDTQITTETTTSAPVKMLDPPSLGSSNPVYSNITTVPLTPSTTLFTIAGQVATRPDGSIPGGSTTAEALSNQLDLCLSKIEACLDAVDAKIQNVTRLVYYITEDAYEYDGKKTRNLVVEKMVGWLQGHRPASCLCVLKGLSEKEFLCEIEAMGVVSK